MSGVGIDGGRNRGICAITGGLLGTAMEWDGQVLKEYSQLQNASLEKILSMSWKGYWQIVARDSGRKMNSFNGGKAFKEHMEFSQIFKQCKKDRLYYLFKGL
jgi:hypothetical protein